MGEPTSVVADDALRVVARLDATLELTDFPAAALEALVAVIPCDVASYNEVDPRVPRIVEHSWPEDFVYPEGATERWAELRHEQPIYAHYVRTGDGSAKRISDFLDRDTYRATQLYRDVYGPLGVEFQLACRLPFAEPQMVAFALSRASEDFTDEERDLLELVRPFLANAHARARTHTLLRQALEQIAAGSTFQALALCEGGSALEPVGARAAEIIDRWFGEDEAAKQALFEWIDTQRSGDVSAFDAREEQIPMVLTHPEAQLAIRFVPRGQPSGPDVLLLGEHATLPAGALEQLGLRPRQAEVLLHVANGLDNGEIAAVLGISVATVRKHLEAAYRALNVNSRAAAVAAVLRLR